MKETPYLGFGIGLRPKHYADLLKNPPKVDWLEIISENFMLDGGRSMSYLEQFQERYKIIPHGVSLSIGSSNSLDWTYLKKLKKLVAQLDPPWFSDHLCWNHYGKKYLHNLMPLPYTSEIIDYVAERIRVVQDYIERPMLIENVSSYVEFTGSTMPEWTFLSEVSEKADCGILLDINNIYVSAKNHHFDPMLYLRSVPKQRVRQYHIAGHDDQGSYILDSHDHAIRDEVWALYTEAIPLFGDVSLMIERDEHIPSLSDLLKELNYAKALWKNTVAAPA